MGFSQDSAAIPGPIGGAAPTRLFEEKWAPDQGPVYSGGQRGGLANLYKQEQDKNPYGANRNPYFSDWADEEKGRQLGDRQQLVDLYNQLDKQAQGGMTPQQQQLRDQQASAVQMQQNVANGAAGGAYAQSAARGALLQNRGVQGAQDIQAQQQLKAADMMSAQNQMMQVATMQRANDLQAQGLSMEDAMRQAEQDIKARGMNIQRQLGYAGLESGAIGNDYSMYQDALRRAANLRMEKIKQGQQDWATALQVGGSIVGGLGKMGGM